LGVSKDFEEFIVREEIEARESSTLVLKIILKLLLDVVQHIIIVLQLVQEIRVVLHSS
jgi:hypothetical protein